MNKRIGTILMGILLIFSSLSIINPVKAVYINGNTLYVGGNGPGNYTRIQDAIDYASSGDTVYVYNGTYKEYVIVNKSLNLIGEDRNTTIIDGDKNGDTINILSNFVNVSGFTIQNSGEDWYIAGIDIRSNNNTITDNNIYFNNLDGVYLENSNNNTITGNNISSNDYRGIILKDSSNNIIEDNIFMYQDTGITLFSSSNNTIYSNDIISNKDNGILITLSSYGNIITRNNVISNGENGIDIFSDNNNISRNNILSNKWNGISLGDSNNNMVFGNHVTSNKGNGILLMGNSDGNIISGNNITSNDDYGIDIFHSCDYNTFFKNNLLNNQNAIDKGSNTWDDSDVSSNPLYYGNYWNDYRGIDEDGDGRGDTPYNVPGYSPHQYNKDRYPLMKAIGIESNPPTKPTKPSGPTRGEFGTVFYYNTTSIDPEGDMIRYGWDWNGDKIVDAWTGLYESGIEVNKSHKWNEGGIYRIRVKSKDIYGYESEWSDTLWVSMPKNKLNYQFNIFFERLLQHFSIFSKILNQIIQ